MCKGIVGLIYGHNYKPVVIKSAAKIPPNLTEVRGDKNLFDEFRDEIFQGIICTRCGDIKKCEK